MNDVVEKGMQFYQRWAREFRTRSFRVRMLFNRKVHTLRVLTRNVRSHVFWVVCLLLVILIFLNTFFLGKVTYFCDLIVEQFVYFWGWLSDGGGESNSAVLRNISFVVAGIIGLTLAGWRSLIARKQAETSESGLQNDRYQKGAEMLGNETCSTRLGGIYALERLARDHPKTYHEQIMKLLSSFARHPTTDTAIEIKFHDEAISKETYHVRPDVYEAVSAIARCKVAQIKNENGSGKNSGSYQTDLSVRYLKKGGPPYINLTNVKLTGADLSDAYLSGADLSSAKLNMAVLSDTILRDAIFYGAVLHGADLDGTNLVGKTYNSPLIGGALYNTLMLNGPSDYDFKGLTQEQLNIAAQHPEGKPPILPPEFHWDEAAAKKNDI